MEHFYNYYARGNVLFNTYADIAIKHYVDAKLIFDFPSEQGLGNKDWIRENLIVSETFAAFAIESFLNDYAAFCFGDEMFNDFFQKLNALAKLQTISGIMFNKIIPKSAPIYIHIKSIFLNRNKNAHNKSFDMVKRLVDCNMFNEMLSENQQENTDDKDIDISMNKSFSWYKKHLLGDIHNGLESLVGLAELAYYIDENDCDANAISKIFGYKADVGNADKLQPRQFIEKLINKLYELNKSYGMLEHMKTKIDVYGDALIHSLDEE